jgi:hypothetical protein
MEDSFWEVRPSLRFFVFSPRHKCSDKTLSTKILIESLSVRDDKSKCVWMCAAELYEPEMSWL